MKNVEILNESSHVLDDDQSIEVDDSPMEESRRNFSTKGIKDKALNNF